MVHDRIAELKSELEEQKQAHEDEISRLKDTVESQQKMYKEEIERLMNLLDTSNAERKLNELFLVEEKFQHQKLREENKALKDESEKLAWGVNHAVRMLEAEEEYSIMLEQEVRSFKEEEQTQSETLDVGSTHFTTSSSS